MRHNPGSLKVENGGQQGWHIQSNAGLGPVATVRYEEDARLFAASPELLESVKQFRELIWSLGVRYPEINNDCQQEIDNCDLMARNAIAKALGEKQ